LKPRFYVNTDSYMDTDALAQGQYFSLLRKYAGDLHACYGNLPKIIYLPHTKFYNELFKTPRDRFMVLDVFCRPLDEFEPDPNYYTLYKLYPGFVVLDVDVKVDPGYLASLFGKTLIEETFKGYHLFYRNPFPSDVSFATFTYRNIPVSLITTYVTAPYSYIAGRLYVKPYSIDYIGYPEPEFIRFVYNNL